MIKFEKDKYFLNCVVSHKTGDFRQKPRFGTGSSLIYLGNYFLYSTLIINELKKYYKREKELTT